MTKKFVRLTLQVDIDKNSLYDDKTLQAEFHNSVEEFIDWFTEEESVGELISLADDVLTLKNVEEIEVEQESENGSILFELCKLGKKR